MNSLSTKEGKKATGTIVSFKKLQATDAMTILKKSDYSTYFRLTRTCTYLREAVARSKTFRLWFPRSVTLLIFETKDSKIPTLGWKDTDWSSENIVADDFIRYKTPIDQVDRTSFHHFYFTNLVIGPDQMASLAGKFENWQLVVEFFSEAQMSCETLTLKEVTDAKACEDIFKLVAPSRLVLECKETDGWKMLENVAKKLSYVQLYLPIPVMPTLLPSLLGTIPSILIRLAFDEAEWDLKNFLRFLKDIIAQVKQLPARSCRYLNISFASYLGDSIPKMVDVKALFKHCAVDMESYQDMGNKYRAEVCLPREEDGNFTTRIEISKQGQGQRIRFDFSLHQKQKKKATCEQ